MNNERYHRNRVIIGNISEGARWFLGFCNELANKLWKDEENCVQLHGRIPELIMEVERGPGCQVQIAGYMMNQMFDDFRRISLYQLEDEQVKIKEVMRGIRDMGREEKAHIWLMMIRII